MLHVEALFTLLPGAEDKEREDEESDYKAIRLRVARFNHFVAYRRFIYFALGVLSSTIR